MNIQTLQEMEKVFLRSGHKVADPPLLVSDDGVMGRGSKRIRVNPGGMNVGGLDAQGFAPFGKVVQGMDVVTKLYSGYGQQPDQQMITMEGRAYLERAESILDSIKKATIEK